MIAIAGESVRAPWTTCPAAGAQLQALVGAPLSDRCLEVAGRTRSDQHCTHQLDVATLAVAPRGPASPPAASTRRQYDIVVPFGLLDGQRHTVTLAARRRARSWRGSSRAARIVAPAPYSEATGGFARWADATFDADTAEAAIVLKRACSIGMSRGIDLDSYPTLADMPGLSPRVLVDAARACTGGAPQPRPHPRLRRAARGDARRGPPAAPDDEMTSAPNASSVAVGAKSVNHT